MLSTSVTLRERARTARSVIEASTHIGRSSLIEGAILGRSCDLRAHVRIHEGVAIGDEVTIGAESVIMPGVRIYPYKEVESGSQLNESLIWESRASTRLFGRDDVSGPRQRRPDAGDGGPARARRSARRSSAARASSPAASRRPRAG